MAHSTRGTKCGSMLLNHHRHTRNNAAVGRGLWQVPQIDGFMAVRLVPLVALCLSQTELEVVASGRRDRCMRVFQDFQPTYTFFISPHTLIMSCIPSCTLSCI